MKKIAILQSNYIPWRGYFDMIQKVDTFVIYDEVQYTKNDWRNRNRIKTPQGTQWLTIPVKQKFLDQKIFETEVVDQKWRRKHLNSIKGNYAKAPYFNQFIGILEQLYEGDEILLSEINKRFLLKMCELLDIKTQIIDSRELNLKGDRNERLLDACKKLNATTYLSGSAAQSYLNLGLFKSNKINVEWMDYAHLLEYPQILPPFDNSVSIIDTLLNFKKIN